MRIFVVALLLALGACTTSLSDQDRALLTAASQNAEQAKQQSAQALAAAQQAQADAKAANDKADRMFQRSLRK
jgi:Alanine-zipper, major outer membrane lipoprotein